MRAPAAATGVLLLGETGMAGAETGASLLHQIAVGGIDGAVDFESAQQCAAIGGHRRVNRVAIEQLDGLSKAIAFARHGVDVEAEFAQRAHVFPYRRAGDPERVAEVDAGMEAAVT